MAKKGEDELVESTGRLLIGALAGNDGVAPILRNQTET